MDIRQLESEVAAHPRDYERRWRLAKKLYLNREYAAALEHLLILRKEWKPRLNVMRYLAAAYFRVGAYGDSVAVLQDALAAWPEEIALHEQLARVHEVAGQRTAAMEAWQRVLRLNSRHTMAFRALRRLQRGEQDTPKDRLKIGDSNSGIDISSAVICPACGAQNSSEFRRCWQCHGVLQGVAPPAPANAAVEKRRLLFPFLSLGAKLVTVALLSLDIYLAIVHWPAAQRAGVGQAAHATVNEAVASALLLPWIVTCLLLFFAWPLVLESLAGVWRHPGRPPAGGVTPGFFLAAATFLFSMTPAVALPYVPLFILVLSFAVVGAMFRFDARRFLPVWAIQGVMALAIGFVTFAGMAEFSLFRDAVAIARVAARTGAAGPSALRYIETRPTPIRATIEWAPTGAAWLDARVTRVEIQLRIQAANPDLLLELRDDEKTCLFKQIQSPEALMGVTVEAGRRYHLSVTGQDGTRVALSILSIFEPTVSFEP